MKVVKLNDHPEYFNQVTSYLYREWKDLYYRVNNCKTIKDMRKLYIELYNSGAETYLLLKHDGTFVGCYTLLHVGGKTYICDLFVVHSFRSRNIGKMLVNNAINRIPKYDPSCNWVYLDTYSNTVVFYMKLGFEIDSKSTMDDRYVMKKRVDGDFLKLPVLIGYVWVLVLLTILFSTIWWFIR